MTRSSASAILFQSRGQAPGNGLRPAFCGTANSTYMPRYMSLILSSLPIMSEGPDMTIDPDSST